MVLPRLTVSNVPQLYTLPVVNILSRHEETEFSKSSLSMETLTVLSVSEASKSIPDLLF